ncbi:MAG: NUDIX domain-containing protein [Alcanivoracaceae bacterium]|nr:NUDIX domain-containing protein [Alcanivoracaceae bacterium]
MRAAIRDEIASINPCDEKERLTQVEVLNWIDSGEELCRLKKPAFPPKHLVSYFAVIDGDYVLLVDHINAKLWLPTGGHIEPNEHPRKAALREAKEELGLDGEFLRDGPILLTSTETVGKTAGHTDVSIWYALKGQKNFPLDFDTSEFYEVRWFHRNDVPMDRTDPEMGRFLDKLYGENT